MGRLCHFYCPWNVSVCTYGRSINSLTQWLVYVPPVLKLKYLHFNLNLTDIYIPNKLGGVIALITSIAILFVIPTNKSKYRETQFYQINQVLFWTITNTVILVEEWKTNLMSLAILFYFLCAQHVSDINISIIRSLRLCCWITTSVVLFSVRCVLENLVRLVLSGARIADWSTTTSATQNQPHQISNTQRTENKTTDVVTQQHSRKLLKMDILMSETCWAHKKWNKIAIDIKLVFHSSTITMMHGPINIRFKTRIVNFRFRLH